MDFILLEEPELEFEAGELAADFDKKYSEAQIEAALQNLCKNGPPPTGGLRIISTFSAGRHVYKRGGLRNATAAAAAAAPPPSKEQIAAHIKVLRETNKAAIESHDYTFKQVQFSPSSAPTATMTHRLRSHPTPL